MKNNRERLPLINDVIQRKRIDNLLEESLKNPVTTVVAGSGYGKTQAVASWATKLENPLVWVNMSSFDNNLNHFLLNLINSTRIELPGIASLLEKIKLPFDFESSHTFLFELTQIMYKYDKIVLVLDNYEVIQSQDVRDFVDSMVESKIDNLNIVVISNRKIVLKEDRFHILVNQLNITDKTLKFTLEEGRTLFESNNIKLTDSQLDELIQKTEGWPVALFLIVLNIKDNKISKESILDSKTIKSIAFDLFETKFTTNYDEKTQRRFVELSMFNSFSKKVVDLLDAEEGTISMEVLKSNMFVSYDLDEEKYYFHSLFKGFLYGKVKQLDEAQKRHICLVVGNYHFTNANYFEALYCYYECNQYSRIVDCFYELLKGNGNKINANRALKGLKSIPSSYAKEDIRVSSLEGICLLINESYDVAYKTLRSTIFKYEGISDDDLQKEVYFALGIIEFINNDSACTVNFKLSEGLVIENCIIEIDSLFHFLNPISVFLHEDWLSSEFGELESSINLINISMDYINKITSNRFEGFEDLYYAKMNFVRGEFDKALEYSTKVMVMTSESAYRLIYLDAVFLRMQIMVFKGNSIELENLKTIVNKEYKNKNYFSVISMLIMIDSWIYSRFCDYDKCVNQYNEKRERLFEDTKGLKGRDLLIQSYILIQKKDYHDAIGIVSSMEDNINMYREQWMIKLVAKIIKAVSYYGLGEKNQAYGYLHEAYEMTYKNKITSPFVEFGSLTRNLMANINKENQYSFDKEWVETIRKKSSYYAKNLSFLRKKITANNDEKTKSVKLTKREVEVLELIAKGFTLQEISQTIYISLSTAKSHMNNIYKKLGAVNRAEAIHFATINKII